MGGEGGGAVCRSLLAIRSSPFAFGSTPFAGLSGCLRTANSEWRTANRHPSQPRNPFQKLRLLTPRHRHRIPVLHNNLPSFPPDVLLDVAQVDQVGIVHPQKAGGGEQLAHIFDGFGQQHALAVHKEQVGVAAFAPAVEDVGHLYEVEAFQGRQGDGFGGGVAGGAGALHELELAPLGRLPLLLGLFHRRFQLLDVDGLEQVVQGADLDGAKGVLVVGRGEDHLEADRAHPLQQVEAVEAGHLDVQKQDVRRVVADESGCLLRVVEFGYDLHLGAVLGQERGEQLGAVEFVVDEDGFHGWRFICRVDKIYSIAGIVFGNLGYCTGRVMGVIGYCMAGA